MDIRDDLGGGGVITGVLKGGRRRLRVREGVVTRDAEAGVTDTLQRWREGLRAEECGCSSSWRASQVVLVVKEPACQCKCKRCRFDPWVGKVPWRKDGTGPHSSILAWRMPWTEEHGGLQSTELHRVGHN